MTDWLLEAYRLQDAVTARPVKRASSEKGAQDETFQENKKVWRVRIYRLPITKPTVTPLDVVSPAASVAN